MKLKKISLILFGALLFWLISFAFQKNRSTRKQSSVPPKAKPIEKKRDLILGEPQIISTKHLPQLKKHIKKQWALRDISILKAWDILDEKANKKPVVVAVVDTGIHTKHPCLKNNLWVNPGEKPNNGKDDDQNGFIDDIHGWNFVDNNNNIQDDHGHGTHVSGIVAAQGNTPKTPNCQVAGVARHHAKIMTLKYFDAKGDEENNIKNTIKSIKYAVQNGADIINYSGGGPGANEDEKAIIAKAADKNIIFVAAMGNEGKKIKKEKYLYYPASYGLSNILSIQSKDEHKIIKSSNFVQTSLLEAEDKAIQIAPGEQIISTMPPPLYTQGHLKSKIFRNLASFKINHNRYGRMTGTSQATAVATGVAVLVKTLYPSWSMEKQINQIIKTGYGEGTEQIKKVTNQGKKLSAHEALIMRDKNVDLSDQIDQTNTAIPHDPDNVDSVLKDPKQRQPENSQLKHLQDLNQFINKKKSK